MSKIVFIWKVENPARRGNIEAKDGKIKLPRFGWVKMSEKITVENIKNVTVSRQAHHWFVSFKTDHKPVKINHPEKVVGVDLGIKTLATLSNTLTFENKRPYKQYKRKLERRDSPVRRG